MADKDKNGPVSDKDNVDWDFDSDDGFAGFGDDDDFGGKDTPKASAAPAAADDDFSDDALAGDSFGDSFDSFGSGFGNEAEDPFAAPPAPDDEEEDAFPAPAAQDDPFGVDDGGFGLEEMPTPGSMSARPAAGDPDSEFGDIGGDAFGTSDGFGDGGDLFDDAEDPEPADPFKGEPDEDPFGSPGDPDDGTTTLIGDPFVSDGEPDPDSEPEPVAERPSRGRSGLVMPLALAATVAFVGYMGYSVLLPMFTSPAIEPARPVAVAPAEPSFPTALPGQPGGLPVDQVQQPSLPAEPERPSLPVVDMPLNPSVPDGLGQPGDLGVADSRPIDGQGAGLPGLPVTAQDNGGVALPGIDDDIAGAEGRGGIIAMRGEGRQAETAPADPEVERRVSRIEERLEAIEGRVEGIARAIGEMTVPPSRHDGPSAPAVPVAAGPVTRADLSASLPPLKPVIVESATLKGVSRGLAWVSTPSGVVEVREGDVIPGAGKVLRIREYQGRWIVSTTEGLVVQ